MVVFEPRTDAVSEYFVCQHIGVSLIFKLFISTNEKMLNNINVLARRQVNQENSSLPVAVRGSKTPRA